MLRLTLGFLLALAGCPTDLPADEPGSDVAAAPADAPPAGASLYPLDVTWTDQDGRSVALHDFRGRPVLVAMIYANCGTACPLIVRDLSALRERLADPKAVEIVLVSLDSERDTPEQLRHFATANGLGEGWTLVRGDAGDVRTLAALLGVRYRAEPGGEIAHSNLVTLLDADGTVAARQEGLGTDPAAMLAALDGLGAPAR